MYGCDHSVGCLSVAAWRIGEELALKASRLDFGEEHEGLSVAAWRIGGGINVSASLTCSLKLPYLQVSTNTIWLTPDMIAERFDIYSDVEWIIN